MNNKIFDIKMSAKSSLMLSVKVTKASGITSLIDLRKIMAEATIFETAISDVTGRFIRIIILVFSGFQPVQHNRNAVKVLSRRKQ